MSVRAAIPEDLPALIELERNCFPHDCWNESSLLDALNDEKYLVLVWEATPLPTAYILGWNVDEEAEIARIGVMPLRRGQGMGKVLLDAAVAAFRDRAVTDIFLEVRSGNVAARRLYDSSDFQQIGLRLGYYADGEDAVVMSRKLSRENL